jgi:hypothetical protein
MNHEPAALDRRAAEAQPRPPARLKLDELTSDDLDRLYRERDQARQHAAAIAAQRDRLRTRMNTLADRWDHALPVDKPYAQTLRAEISVAPFDPDGAMAVREYTERGRRLWVFRCWGTEACDGWLGLGHHTQTSALLERERHVAEEHAEPTAEGRLSHLQATSAAAGRLLTRTTDERDQLRAERDAARATNRRLNLRSQKLESELATYRRAVDQWEISDAHAYVPLHTVAAIAKAAGLEVPARWEPHYQRVERITAERDSLGREADRLRKDWVEMRTRAEHAEAALARVRAECERITQLPPVANNSGRTDTFDCGARWTIRMIRSALDHPAPVSDSPPIVGLWAPVCPPHQDGAECPCPPSCDCCKPEPAPVSGPATTQATDTTAARTARIRSLTLPAPGRQLAPHISRRLPGILHLGHRPTSLDMALIAEAADVSVDWLLYGDAGTPAPDRAGLREQPAPTVDRQTAAVLAALHRSAEADVSRVIDLYERWVKAGPPPLGVILARWWDMRLAELHTAILNPAKEQS